MRATTILTGAALAAVLLTGCGPAGTEPAGLTAAPTTAASSEPDPAPSPTVMTASDLSDPDGVGVVFVETPDLTGAAASAHDAVAIFEKEYWRSLTTGQVSPLIPPLVSESVHGLVDNSVQQNAANGFSVDGVLRVTILDVQVNGADASARVCQDYADVTLISADGTSQSAADAGLTDLPALAASLSSADDGATWTLQTYTEGDGPC